MGFDVNITTKVKLFDLLCPGRCRCCDEIGNLLCDRCKKDLLDENRNYCLYCQRPIYEYTCPYCKCPPTYMIGWRNSIIGKLVSEYKYASSRSIADLFTDLLDYTLPFIDGEVHVVPLPTIQKHVRERGFDHTLLLAKKLCKRRGWVVDKILARNKNTVQVGSDSIVRIKQATSAYLLCGAVNPNATYILLDDVWTTGASMKAATKMLQQAGASKLMLTVLAVSRAGQD